MIGLTYKERKEIMNRTLNGLLTSRKFWLAVVGLIGAVVLYVQGAIDADALVTAIVTLMAILIGAIAVEDTAGKLGSGR